MRSPLLALAVCAVLASCYTPQGSRRLMQRSVEARELYREDGFAREDLSREGVTCLAPRLRFGQETYGKPLTQGLVEALQRQLGGARVLHPNLAASQINAAGLARAYAEMMGAYDQTNILDRDGLRRIGEVLDVRYLAIPILVDFREESATRLSVFGLRIGRTASATARFQLQIWDAESGHIAWEGLSDLTLAQDVIRERAIGFEATAAATWEALIAKLPSRIAS
jgi:hypothetical protein